MSFEPFSRDEQWDAMSLRRAEAMNRHLGLTTEQGPGPQHTTESDRTAYPFRSRPVDAEAEGTGWLRGVGIVREHWRLSALFTLVVVASVTAATLMMKPVYEPQARVQVDPPGAEVFSLQGNNSSGAATDYLATQAQNLQNDELTLDVIRKLHLDQSPFSGGAPGAISGTPSLATEIVVPLTPAEEKALIVFKQSRKITRDVASRLITVSVSAHNPVVAAAVTNTLVNMFIERDYKLRNDAILQSSEWLQRQLEDIRQRMDDSNLALNNFEKANGVDAIGDNQNRFSEQMVELSRQLMQAQADRIQLQSYLNDLNGAKDSSLPQISSNPVVQELTKKLAEVRAEIAETRAVYGASHPNTKKLQNEADELQSQLNTERSEILRDMKTSYTAAQAREHLMQSQMQGASKQMVVLAQYNALKKESDANTQLYQALYQKIKEAAIAAETKSSNIRVVDRARVLDRPTRPYRSQNIALGLLVGLIGGVIVAFLREAMDTRIHTPEDIKKCLGAESVSVVPVIGNGEPAAQARSRSRLQQHTPQRNPYLFQVDRPNSLEGEALRGIGVTVRLSRQNGCTPQVILVVSPLTGEGKTTLSINLALTLARHGRTCIVDADLRKEGVAPALGVVAKYGLREVLSESMGVDQALVSAVQLPNLSLLASGTAPGDPSALISSTRMSGLVGKLRQRFEFIVIDSPPMLLFSDGRALSVLADGIIVVGRSGVTTRETLKRVIELLDGVRSAPIVELVLNAAESPITDYHYYRRYDMAS
ncbi:GumC family protein [Edaphobacter bradus]|uniref:GumC family protein n=1 Tax=Edaphobacter bradus TaxID=2259016 RepID=UPI0021E06CF0|nr:polysaccharide biosynthesis tyrosine autokinase [Edaphobacter bradus]